MNYKKLGRALLYPHIAVMIMLVPISTVSLVCAMIFLGSESPLSIASYVLAAYTLTVWCFKIPYLIDFFKTFKNENKLAIRWRSDERLRVNVSLYASLVINSLYAAFQFFLGLLHNSFWFYSFAAYYVLLAVMRFFLLRYTRTKSAGENMRLELLKYRVCGVIFLIMNLALALIVFFMVYWNRTFVHHEITTIAMAAYTFTAFTLAIINIIKYRKYNSPVYSASKSISLTAACVSMLTLESTMLNTWGRGESAEFSRIMLAITGAVISVFVIFMAVYMIVLGNRGLKNLKNSQNGS